MNATTVPEGVLASEVHVAVPSDEWHQVEQRLRAAAPDEGCVFLLTRPSRGVRRVTVLASQAIWPEPGEVQATPHSLELSADFISRAIDAAADAGPQVGLALVHTHPETEFGPGRARFSPRDDWYEERLFRTAFLGKPDALFASIVVGSEPGAIDARVYWTEQEVLTTQPAHALRVVGPTLTILETSASNWTDHPDPVVMDRSVRVLGKQGQRLLQNLRVGVVGLGGTGSPVAVNLATMGVGQLQLWEHDRISKHNRPRLIGITAASIGQPKVTALATTLRACGTAHGFQVDDHDAWGTSREALIALRDCDLIFCCVDLYGPRVPLNDLAYAHLIPVIDLGSRVYPAGDRIEALLSHAQAWSPGLPCAWDNQTLTPANLVAEAQGSQRGAERRVAYGLPIESMDGVEPSVLPLNAASVGLAMLIFLQVVFHLGDRTPGDLRLTVPGWELDECDLTTRPSCNCHEDVAKGDTLDIRPFLLPDPIEEGGEEHG